MKVKQTKWKENEERRQIERRTKARKRKKRQINTQAVSYGEPFFLGCRPFFAFKLVNAPYREEIEPPLLGINKFDYSRRGTQAIFPLLDCRSREIFGLAHFSIFLPDFFFTRDPILINCQFSDYIVEKWASPKFSQLRLSRSGKLVWVPLRE